MEHKAFVFRYRDFQRELRPLLERALITGDPQPLIGFIRADIGSFRDPYEGKPLSQTWEHLVEIKDVHQYGDFALTKYYDPTADIGLGRAWDEVRRALEEKLGTSAPLLGEPVEIDGRCFDAGKMGSYFQSEHDVRRNLREIAAMEEQRLTPLVALLKEAAQSGEGIYVTF